MTAGLDALRAGLGQAVLALDYDGTLAPIVADPSRAVPAPGAVEVLRRPGAARADARAGDRPTRRRRRRARRARRGARAGGARPVRRAALAGGALDGPSPLPGVARARERAAAACSPPRARVARGQGRSSLVVHTRPCAGPGGRPASGSRRRCRRAGGAAAGWRCTRGGWSSSCGRRASTSGGALLSLCDPAPSAVLFAGDDLGDLPAFDAVDELRARGVAGRAGVQRQRRGPAGAARAGRPRRRRPGRGRRAARGPAALSGRSGLLAALGEGRSAATWAGSSDGPDRAAAPPRRARARDGRAPPSTRASRSAPPRGPARRSRRRRSPRCARRGRRGRRRVERDVASPPRAGWRCGPRRPAAGRRRAARAGRAAAAPGRSRSGRLVAPMTTTSRRSSTPSSSVSSGGDDPVGRAAVGRLPAGRRERVDLVEEHDRGRRLAGPPEQLAHRPLGLADPLAQQLGALHRQHVGLAGAGDRLDQEGLPAAGRAVQQQPARRRDPEPGEGVGVLQRPQHRLGERPALTSTMSPTSSSVMGDRSSVAPSIDGRAHHLERGDRSPPRRPSGASVSRCRRGGAQPGLADERQQVGGDEARGPAGDFVEGDVRRRAAPCAWRPRAAAAAARGRAAGSPARGRACRASAARGRRRSGRDVVQTTRGPAVDGRSRRASSKHRQQRAGALARGDAPRRRRSARRRAVAAGVGEQRDAAAAPRRWARRGERRSPQPAPAGRRPRPRRPRPERPCPSRTAPVTQHAHAGGRCRGGPAGRGGGSRARATP